MAKLKLNPDPTFKETVPLSVPGSPLAKVEFTFKHRTRDQMDQFLKALDGMSDAEMILKMCTGWDLSDDFNEMNVKALAENYISAPKEIFEIYVKALTGNRSKN